MTKIVPLLKGQSSLVLRPMLEHYQTVEGEIRAFDIKLMQFVIDSQDMVELLRQRSLKFDTVNTWLWLWFAEEKAYAERRLLEKPQLNGKVMDYYGDRPQEVENMREVFKDLHPTIAIHFEQLITEAVRSKISHAA